MELYPDRCPHKSIPVETDESMTSSSLNLVLPACHLCLEPGETKRHHWFTPEVTINDVSRMNYPEDYWSRNPAEQRGKTPVCHATSASGPPHRQLHVDPPSSLNQRLDPFLMEPPQILQRERDRRKEFSASPSRFCRDLYEPPSQTWNSPSEEEESLEPPLPLCSDPGDSPYQNALQYRPSYYGLQVNPQHHNFEASKCAKEFPCRQLPNLICQKNQQPQLEPRNCPQSWKNSPNAPGHATSPQSTVPHREVMSELCVSPSKGPAPGQIPTQEIRKTISLPDDCRNVFITYSVDTAEEIIPFVGFLTAQGFRPAIDIFDDPVRRMDINKWMDSYLKDKSVLIIVVISPKYKIDIEGDCIDEHGLHTKYIHTQLQNEFIQQRCLNFRIVPVLFPNANTSHVPIWLQSTRLYRWPQDVQDLLLRLLREERYIVPPLGKELTLTVRPI